jgi:hypothetical protein
MFQNAFSKSLAKCGGQHQQSKIKLWYNNSTPPSFALIISLSKKHATQKDKVPHLEGPFHCNTQTTFSLQD